MKLRSLTLSNVRKFAGQKAKISGIGDGVTVVSEANEFGKSTFFDALHALFFFKYGAATREVKSLQPRSGGPVRVSAEIELPTGRFTIEKSFLAQKRASVHDSAGTLVALDDEAENWIAQLMGSGLDGPAGLLWVRQGITALEPSGSTGADKTEKERLLGARRNLLSSVAGEIDMVTGGRRMDRVIEAAKLALGRLATATGQPKAKGPWKEAEQEAQAHAAQHADLDARCRELSQALTQRRETMMRLKVLEAPGAQEALVQAFEQAQVAHNGALAHADKLAQMQAQVDLKKLELDSAQVKLDALISSANEYEGARQALESATTDHINGIEALEVAEVATQNALEKLTAATSQLNMAMKAKEDAQKDALRQNAAEKYARLNTVLMQVEEKRSVLEKLTAILATLPITEAMMGQLEVAQAEYTRVQAEAVSGGVKIHLTYEGAGKVMIDGAPMDAGPHHIATAQEFELPGIGRMALDPGAAAVDMAAVEAAKGVLTEQLAAISMVNLEVARRAAQSRKEKVEEITLLKNILETLAPEGVEHLQADVARAQVELEDLSTGMSQDATLFDPSALAAQVETARVAEQDERIAYEQIRDTRDTARTNSARLQVIRDNAQSRFDFTAAIYGDPASFLDRKTQAGRIHSTAQLAAADAGGVVQELKTAAPDLGTTQANLSRAQSAAENARDERGQLQTRSADLSATIRARAEDGVEERRDEAKGKMKRAQNRAARFAHEAAGLTLLVEALLAKRGAAQDAYFGPVQQELAPLLALLHADAALSFDPGSLLPQGIARGGMEEPMEMLSGGTQEQIAILTRLAFARLFARQGKPMPVILDDALVYSDDSRISAMFTALHRVANDQQVIVFSCRQMAFAGLGGTRPMVEITQDH